EYEPPSNIKRLSERWKVEIPKYYRGVGCRKCRNTGYIGRIAIHEMFLPNETVLDAITEGVTIKKLRKMAIDNGMLPLHLDGVEKVKAGITTMEEILRVNSA
ncbi:MAG: type II/IV secretion system protein, partial [Planctomycetes bacterium]|nr:type II/IV secretion system protein [Planctomycetota bacterium]